MKGLKKEIIITMFSAVVLFTQPILGDQSGQAEQPPCQAMGMTAATAQKAPEYAPMAGPGKKITIDNDYYFIYEFDKKPKLLELVETRLGDKFKGLYETIDVPYTIYEIYKKQEKIGYIHGVNRKGKYGGIQVFLVLDLSGSIRGFYIQKMTSQYAGKLRAASFGKQFNGLTLQDFEAYDVTTGRGSGKVESIKNPVPEAEVDVRAVLRAAKKNLILMDEFVFRPQAEAK
ncbi:MAG: hypothetical protein EHM45_18525 [Desulfobacteraceae bacterium]|nr:MAG: hypothetical protein EHM45_18525 [Desulfobacteraceae bacterium]